MAFSVATYVRRAEQERMMERERREERRRRQSQIETYRHREREHLASEDAVRSMTRVPNHQSQQSESEFTFNNLHNYVDVVVRDDTELQDQGRRGGEGVEEAPSTLGAQAAAALEGERERSETETQERSPLSGGSCSAASASTSSAASFSNTNDINEQAECRICQDVDEVHLLEQPCNCKGSLRYVHQKCLQKWCLEKGDLMCEICKTQFKGDYYVPPPQPPLSSQRQLINPHLVLSHGAQSDLMQAAYSRAFVGWLIPERAVTNTTRSRDGDGDGDGDAIETAGREGDNESSNRFFTKPMRVYLMLLLFVSTIHTTLLFVNDEKAADLTYMFAFAFRVLIFFIPFLVVARILDTWQHYRRLRDEREPAIFFYDRNRNRNRNQAEPNHNMIHRMA